MIGFSQDLGYRTCPCRRNSGVDTYLGIASSFLAFNDTKLWGSAYGSIISIYESGMPIECRVAISAHAGSLARSKFCSVVSRVLFTW